LLIGISPTLNGLEPRTVFFAVHSILNTSTLENSVDKKSFRAYKSRRLSANAANELRNTGNSQEHFSASR